MTVIKDKATINCNKPTVEKYGGYILPFDHFNNLTVYSRIWKNLSQDRYDYMCGKIVLQTEGLQQRMNTTTCSDILAGVKIDCGNTRKNTLLFHEERNNNKCLFEKPNNNNNNSPRFSGASKTEWFLHPRVQDLVDHQMALMEVTDSTCFPNLADNKDFSRCGLFAESLISKSSNDEIPKSFWSLQKFAHESTAVTYNNPFDEHLFFDGLILRKNKYLPLGKAKKYSTANILIGMENVSTLLEEHTSKYRLYNLALLQESDIPMSPNQGKSHNSESIRRPQLSSLLQLSSFKCTKDYDKDTTELVQAFADNKFEQIWHSDKFGDASIQINPLTKKKSLDLWDLPRAELPSQVQLSPDSKILLWNVSEQTDSPIESLQHQTNETNQGLNIQAPVFEPTDPKLSSAPSVHSARRRLWDDVPEDDNDFDEERIEIAKQPRRRSISDSELRSLNRCLDFGILDESGSKSSSLEESKNDQERISPVIPDAVQQQAVRPIPIDVKTHQSRPPVRSYTPDYHVHKHAVVSIKDVEQQLHQQHRYTTYPIDVMCSPYHLSQHMQRQFAIRQTQAAQPNIQHVQTYYEHSSKPFQPNLANQHIQNVQHMQPLNMPSQQSLGSHSIGGLMQAPRPPIDINIRPRTQVTYAQVANQQGNPHREAPRMHNQLQQQASHIPMLDSKPVHFENEGGRQHQQFYHQAQIPQPNIIHGQYQEHLLRQPQQQYSQNLLLEQHKGTDRSFQQTQAFHQEQLHRQALQQHMWSFQPEQQSGTTSNNQHTHIPHPTVRQMFLQASTQPMQGINTMAPQFYQQTTIPDSLPSTLHSRTQSSIFTEPHHVHSYHDHRLPWNNNNNSDMYSYQDPSGGISHREMGRNIPSLLSLDVSFKPEAARVFQLSRQSHQNLPANPWQVQKQDEQQQLNQNVCLQQQRDLQFQYRSMHDQNDPYVHNASAADQLFRDAASVSFNTNAINHSNMR